jgi:hypothetical protein
LLLALIEIILVISIQFTETQSHLGTKETLLSTLILHAFVIVKKGHVYLHSLIPWLHVVSSKKVHMHQLNIPHLEQTWKEE